MREESTMLIFVGGVAAIGIAAFSAIKMGRIEKKLGDSITSLADKTVPEIQDAMVQRAIDTAVNREVEKQVKIASENAVLAVKNDISRQVRKAVEDAYGEVEHDVKLKLEKEVGEVNIDKIKREVIERAKDRAAEKFEDDMNDILQKYNENLEQVSKIYGGIAKTITGTVSPDLQSLRRALMYG